MDADVKETHFCIASVSGTKNPTFTAWLHRSTFRLFAIPWPNCSGFLSPLHHRIEMKEEEYKH